MPFYYMLIVMSRGRFHVIRSEIRGVEAVAADSAHTFGRHIHGQFGIGVILRGAQKSSSGRGVVEAEAGDVITVNPDEVHDGSPIGDHGRSWQMLYFDPDVFIKPIHALTDGRDDMAELSHPAIKDLVSAKLFLNLYHAITDKNGGDSEIQFHENLLILLARLIELASCEHKNAVPKNIVKAQSRIDDDPSVAVTLDELANIAGISQFQLIRGFSKFTGLTPHAYLVQRRLQRARIMIATGGALSNIAHVCGFADQSHMTRLFVSAYGMTPGNYAAAQH